MKSSLALVWVAPSRTERGKPEGNATDRRGNGQPSPSTLLVLEDEILIRLAVCDYLRQCGYRVLEAGSGEEAQAIFGAGEQVEILFSDIELAGEMTGFDVARWVRTHYPGVRIILTSGVARMAQDTADLCDGPFLEKPYDHAALADQIKRLLGAFARSGIK